MQLQKVALLKGLSVCKILFFLFLFLFFVLFFSFLSKDSLESPQSNAMYDMLIIEYLLPYTHHPILTMNQQLTLSTQYLTSITGYSMIAENNSTCRITSLNTKYSLTTRHYIYSPQNTHHAKLTTHFSSLGTLNTVLNYTDTCLYIVL